VSSAREASKSLDPDMIEPRMRAGVTIGIPIYRGKPFLEESLASVHHQTYREIEVLLSLDGPDPECEEICQRFLSDSRFRLVVQPRRLGWMNHANWLMAQVQTEFWHLQEQDDVIEPTFLETLVEHARAHPNAASVFGDVSTFGDFEIQIRMSSVVGDAVTRQLKLIYEHFQGVAPLGLIRTEALRLCGGLQANEFENFAADTTLMAGLARWGELHRLPLDLYRKRVHAEGTHATWWGWATDKRCKAWQAHCLDMLQQALLIDTTPQDRRLLWLAVVERLVSPRTASHFLPIAELTVTERAVMLDSFLKRARTSSIDIPKSLDATWDEIDSWTRGFYWVPLKSPEPSTD
jgi:Glycosyl transferase family 2